MTFYTLNMAVEQVEAKLWAREKMQILIFCENFQIFKKIKIFNFSPAHSYVLRACWEYKKSFPDIREAKKTKNNAK